ncbi:head GIN domain-containing protein [uncultured Algibacter sp.]|uniref:head GIN domain-containing protein n=1 Tax=uncultured Algibacter sp. TaxID=298659 RepID=UPI00261D34E7|nr:head GIN domain-containing protein [uncultured Algibacter sp.]
MKKIIYILGLFILFACDSESAGDCFQTTGTIVQQEFVLADFTKIVVHRDIELVVKEGSVQKVVVETGKNLMNDVHVEVVGNQLILMDNNGCNLSRAYGVTKAYVTAPSISEIRSMTQYDVKSDGVLTYPNLTLLSEDFSESGTVNSGNFYLELDNNSLSVVFNNLSNAVISGETNDLRITLAAGSSRVDTSDLVAQNVSLSHRSSNDIIVNPQLKITGKILGTGDVIALNKPATVEVEAIYKGHLIFK